MGKRYIHDEELAEDYGSIRNHLDRVTEAVGSVRDALLDDSYADTDDLIKMARYYEKAVRLESELTSFLVLEDTVRVAFPDLSDISAEYFFGIQKNVNGKVNDFIESVTFFRDVARTWPAKDSRLINLQRDMIEFADDALDILGRRKDALNEFMSEIGEQFE